MLDDIKLDTDKTMTHSTSNTVDYLSKTDPDATATSASDIIEPLCSNKKKVLNDESIEGEEIPV